MEFDVECPECKEQQSFERSIRDAFDLMEFLEEEYQIELQSGLKIYMSPHNLKTSTKANLAQFEQAKIMQLIDRDSETDEAKLRIFSDSFKKMVTMTFDMVADSIIKVQTPDGQLFTDRKMINELIRELEKGEIDTIREQITKLNQTGVPIEVDCKCKSCGNEWKEHGMTFDPSHFFD